MKTHQLSSTKLYSRWCDIKKRCYNPNCVAYKRYGGRGITMCDEWKNDFKSFYDWSMANGYRDDLTIDRIDNNKGYAPDNCRWVTYKVQGNNKSNNVYISYQGKTKTLSEWCDILELPYERTRERIQNLDWSVEKAFNSNRFERYNNSENTGRFTSKNFITIDGETKSLTEWCKLYNIKYQIVWKRYFMRGWDIVSALTTPPKKH